MAGSRPGPDPGGPRTPGCGRKLGTPNHITTDMRKAFIEAFDKLGGAQGLYEWGKKNPSEFYPMMKAILPREWKVDAGSTFEDLLLASFGRPRPAPPAPPAPPGPAA